MLPDVRATLTLACEDPRLPGGNTYPPMGTSDQLKSQVGGERIEVIIRDREALPRAREVLARECGEEPTLDEHTRKLTVPAHGGVQTLISIVRDLDGASIHIDDIGLRRPTLDDVFLALTGHLTVEEQLADDAETLRRTA